MPPRQDTTAWGTEPGLPTTEEGKRILEEAPWPKDTSEPEPPIEVRQPIKPSIEQFVEEQRAAEKKAWAEGQRRMIEREEKRYGEALVTLKPYRVEGNRYDLSRAIADRVPESKLKLIFGASKVRDYKEMAYPSYEPSPGEVPRKSIPRAVWRIMTPWAEQNGETFLSYYRGTTGKMISREPEPQENLKALYESQNARPMWMQVLSGREVVRDSKNGKYYRIIASEPPMVSPAGKATKLAQVAVDVSTKKLLIQTPESLGISEEMFNIELEARLGKLFSGKFKNLPTKPIIKQIQEEIDLINKAKSGAKIATEGYKFAPEEVARIQKERQLLDALKKGYKNYLDELARLANRGDKDAIATLKTLGKLRAATTTEARAFTIPGRLTQSRMEELLKEWSSMKPTAALRDMANIGGLLPAIAAKPEVVAQALARTDPDTRAKVLAQIDPEIADALQEGELTEAQTKALEKIQPATEGATKAEIKESVIESVGIKTATAPTITAISTIKTPEPPSRPPAITFRPPAIPTEPPMPPEPPLKPPSEPPRLKGDEEEPTKLKEWRSEWAPSAIAWKQGFTYWVIKEPYQSKDDVFHFNKNNLPAGVKPMPFAKARESFQKLGPRTPSSLMIDLGIVDVKAGHSLDFTGDPEQQTKGDITIGGVRIREVKPTIVGGGRERTTNRRRNNGIIRKLRIKDLGMGIVQEGRRRHLRLV